MAGPRAHSRYDTSLRRTPLKIEEPEILLTREPEVAEFPTAVRLYTRLLAISTALSRKGTIVLHYRF
jgi:hypothetical protein